ncbi:MAG: hypothetical protein BMS9Abin11_0147 [Gammaproteobacteria bacterium]|nr:MAG: hypothetical protein BMS9Abin11_0147 [Gammaproteobacteria bacterium]
MKQALQITFHNMKPSKAVEDKIQERAEKLSHFYEHISHCKVVVDIPHKHKHKGEAYHITINIGVPQGNIVVSKGTEKGSSYEDVYVVIRDAFNAARRCIEDFARKRRGEVKTHSAMA